MNDYREETALDVTNPAPRCPVILMSGLHPYAQCGGGD